MPLSTNIELNIDKNCLFLCYLLVWGPVGVVVEGQINLLGLPALKNLIKGLL